jgi:hypothetical protein
VAEAPERRRGLATRSPAKKDWLAERLRVASCAGRPCMRLRLPCRELPAPGRLRLFVRTASGGPTQPNQGGAPPYVLTRGVLPIAYSSGSDQLKCTIDVCSAPMRPAVTWRRASTAVVSRAGPTDWRRPLRSSQ